MTLREHTRFLSEFAFKPRVIGAVAPSSQRLAEKMVEWIDWASVAAVVEYGPGTGVFTKQILARMAPGTQLVAVEINPKFAGLLGQRYPEICVCMDSVKNMGQICRREGIDGVDAVVSGLPWASLSREEQSELLRATQSVLKPGGRFVTFAYLQGLLLASGRRFRRLLAEHFSEVEMSETVWRNVPPAFVYRCRL